jgi:metallopeptidase MepB
LYSSAAAFAQDLFDGTFANDPLSKDAWNRYRREILEYGGSYGNEIQMLEKFLGRKSNLDAFFASLD